MIILKIVHIKCSYLYYKKTKSHADNMNIDWQQEQRNGQTKAKEEIKEEIIFLLVDNDGFLSIISGK